MKKNEKPQKTFLGMPVNWDAKNWRLDLWNPNETRMFPPKKFGIGWGLNVHAVLRQIGLLPKKRGPHK